MAAYHSVTRWLCPECSCDPDKEEEEETLFATESDYRTHMLEAHDGSFEPIDLPMLLDLGERTMIEPVPCPLCLHDQSLAHVEHDEHIATHLHSFSLRALPWDFDLDEGVASAGSSDPPPDPGHGLLVEDSDDEAADVLPETLDEAVSDFIKSVDSLAEREDFILGGGPAREILVTAKRVLTGSIFREAVARFDASQRQKCYFVITRIAGTVEQLHALGPQDEGLDDHRRELLFNIELLDSEAEACLSKAPRQDHDLWQEAFESLPKRTKAAVQGMINDEEINTRSVPEQLNNLLGLAWNIQGRGGSQFSAEERQYADDIAASIQLIGDDESIFLSPQTNLPWAAILGPMKVVPPSHRPPRSSYYYASSNVNFVLRTLPLLWGKAPSTRP